MKSTQRPTRRGDEARTIDSRRTVDDTSRRAHMMHIERRDDYNAAVLEFLQRSQRGDDNG
jgi:hypothetical protein